MFVARRNSTFATNLAQLPLRDPMFLMADGQRVLPETLQLASATLRSELFHVGDVAHQLGLAVGDREWPAIELSVCSAANTLLLNRYSPLSFVAKRHAEFRAALQGGGLAAAPVDAAADGTSVRPRRADGTRPLSVVWWTRLDTDACVPLFTRTARFDIQPNRFGILGQFGPERKLQLATTNVSRLIGWDGKIIPNATVELEVYVSNESHPLHIFEYTKDNNQKGLQFAVQAPPDGWRTHTWHDIVVPIGDSEYSFPMSTPWDRMDRLELYYANPAASQPRGDYIRIRNVFIRSTRSFGRLGGSQPPRRHQKCSELTPLNAAGVEPWKQSMAVYRTTEKSMPEVAGPGAPPPSGTTAEQGAI